MVCDMPGCRGESSATYSKCGVFHGVNIHHVVLHVCDAHGPEDISKELEAACGRAAVMAQDVNPFLAAKNASLMAK